MGIPLLTGQNLYDDTFFKHVVDVIEMIEQANLYSPKAMAKFSMNISVSAPFGLMLSLLYWRVFNQIYHNLHNLHFKIIPP